ncbi:MAG: class I SAM-dependent methyltransferase [Deltaproteobacteria bacterium]|nr:class I SAM-dependent methyltransferase [Deltaproteobacteria bacterium]
MSGENRRRWDAAHARAAGGETPPPAPFLVEHVALLPVGRTLDLAAGAGRNARFLAGRGHRVVAADASRVALAEIRRRCPDVATVQVDFDHPCVRPASVDAIVCVNFLDRRLFPEFRAWLRPGGVLLLDTFLVDQRQVGHPRNPDFLLGRNELLERLAGYRVLRYREGPVEAGSAVHYRAGIVAVRPQN